MKLKHTQARKDRRHSAWVKLSNSSAGMSSTRNEKRSMFHRAKQKTFGCHVVRVQRIFLKKDRFGSPIYKYVKHGAMVKSLPKQEEA